MSEPQPEAKRRKAAGTQKTGKRDLCEQWQYCTDQDHTARPNCTKAGGDCHGARTGSGTAQRAFTQQVADAQDHQGESGQRPKAQSDVESGKYKHVRFPSGEGGKSWKGRGLAKKSLRKRR